MTDKIKQAREALELLHQNHKLICGKYDYQCGFLDCLKLAKQVIREAALEKLDAIDGKALGEALTEEIWMLEADHADENTKAIYQAARAVAEIKGEE